MVAAAAQWLILLLLWLEVLAMVFFLMGFFPLKTHLTGDATPLTEEMEFGGKNLSEFWTRRVGQVVLVLIDALRADFVFDSESLSKIGIRYEEKKRPKISYLNDLFRNGGDDDDFIGMIAEAAPPTVTLPRIKALTTGSIPGYIDVILNFGSSALTEDSILRQWKKDNLSLTFFGDETWIKLFPGYFSRSDGTTSFFVTDYTEVDDNVTRHLAHELPRNDWDIMALHYLGLDHIGHFVGPSSDLVSPKLEEMSKIIQTIRTALYSKPWKNGLPPLILVLGDHGMSDLGSHGGSSLSEVMTPIVAISPIFAQNKLSSKTLDLVKQPDLVPTLAWLTGVPIPCNNYGILISSFMEAQSRKLTGLYNLEQIARVMRANFNRFHESEGYREYELIRNGKSSGDSYYSAARKMRDVLEENILEYHYGYMTAGFISMISISWFVLRKFELDTSMFLIHLCRVCAQGSTSFIEEEHQVIYFFTMTFVFHLFYRELRNKNQWWNWSGLLLVALILRFARTLNQTGDKWAHLPDLSDWLIRRPELLFGVFFLSWCSTFGLRMSQTRFGGNPISILIMSLIYLTVLAQKVASTDIFQDFLSKRGTTEAQLVYSFSFIYGLLSILRKGRKNVGEIILDSLLPVFMVLNQTHNSVLFVVILFIERILWSCSLKYHHHRCQAQFLTALYFLFGLSSFFHQGNSSASLSNIDVGSGYIGVSSFNSAIVGVLLTLNTYTGPIIWTLLLYERIFHEKKVCPEKEIKVIIQTTSVLRGCELSFFLVIVTIQRYHLFVWTVFSPKLLYQGMLTLVLAIIHTFIFVLYKLKYNYFYD